MALTIPPALIASEAARMTPTVAASVPSSPDWMHRVGLPVLLSGGAFDGLTTLAALRRPGTGEANPIFGGSNPVVIAAVKALADGLAAWLLDKAHHKGNKVALPVAIGLGAGQAAIGVHNLQQGRR